MYQMTREHSTWGLELELYTDTSLFSLTTAPGVALLVPTELPVEEAVAISRTPAPSCSWFNRISTLVRQTLHPLLKTRN